MSTRRKRGSQSLIKYSQSLINEAMIKDICPRALQYKYVDKIEADNEDEKIAFLKGRYFEWHLLGATRDGVEPRFEQLKTGKTLPGGGKDYRPQAQIDLDELVIYAGTLLGEMGLDVKQGEKQVKLTSEDMEGHLDWVTEDLSGIRDRIALYDVKYTETQYDDRYRGWADFETKQESKIQAVHYILLYYLVYGEYLPFYFLIFGKSFWCRVIKVELTGDGVDWHQRMLNGVREKAAKWIADGWPPAPEFNKCLTCGYRSICKDKAHIPQIETFTI